MTDGVIQGDRLDGLDGVVGDRVWSWSLSWMKIAGARGPAAVQSRLPDASRRVDCIELRSFRKIFVLNGGHRGGRGDVRPWTDHWALCP